MDFTIWILPYVYSTRYRCRSYTVLVDCTVVPFGYDVLRLFTYYYAVGIPTIYTFVLGVLPRCGFARYVAYARLLPHGYIRSGSHLHGYGTLPVFTPRLPLPPFIAYTPRSPATVVIYVAVAVTTRVSVPDAIV